jgi:hypothetical protein
MPRSPSLGGPSIVAAEMSYYGPVYGPGAVPVVNAGASGAITGVIADLGVGNDTTVLFLTGAQSGGQPYNLVSVASIIASLPQPNNIDVVGSSYFWRVINAGSGQILTVTAPGGSGWTLNAIAGVATLANNTYRDFIVTITSATTGTIQDIGTGTWS